MPNTPQETTEEVAALPQHTINPHLLCPHCNGCLLGTGIDFVAGTRGTEWGHVYFDRSGRNYETDDSETGDWDDDGPEFKCGNCRAEIPNIEVIENATVLLYNIFHELNLAYDDIRQPFDNMHRQGWGFVYSASANAQNQIEYFYNPLLIEKIKEAIEEGEHPEVNFEHEQYAVMQHVQNLIVQARRETPTTTVPPNQFNPENTFQYVGGFDNGQVIQQEERDPIHSPVVASTRHHRRWQQQGTENVVECTNRRCKAMFEVDPDYDTATCPSCKKEINITT